MKKIIVAPKLVDDSKFLKKQAELSHCSEIIDEDCIIYAGENIVGIYKRLDKNLLKTIREISHKSPFIEGTRSNGLKTRSAIYGALPRTNHRNPICRWSAHTLEQRGYFNAVREFSNVITEIYDNFLPVEAERHRDVIRQNIEKDWVLGDTPFTTFNLNINTAIKYHRDTGNFKNIFSNVLILQENIVGGELIFPELNIGLSQRDGYLGIFDGQKWMHGCTEVKKTKLTGYRVSAVFYAMEAMKHCYPYKAELIHAKTWRTKVESRFRPDANEIHSGGRAANI